MPFHSHHHQNAAFTPSQGLSQAAQALGSIGVPTGNLRVATSGTTNAGTDALMPGSGNPTAGALPNPPPPQQQQQQQQQPRSFKPQHAATNEELHINTMNQPQRAPAQPAASQQQHLYNSPGQYSAPNVNLHWVTPSSQYSSAP